MFWPFKRKKRRREEPRADFSSVDSIEKARQLCDEGMLEQIQLVPSDYGGVDIPMNMLYVPVGVGKFKQQVDEKMVGDLIEKGAVSEYAVDPEYAGTSVVPIALTVRAWNPGEFSTRIDIWAMPDAS
jgi:hypothetical protein